MTRIFGILIETCIIAVVLFLALEGAAGLLLPEPLRTARRFPQDQVTGSPYAPTVGRFYAPHLVDIEHVDTVGNKIISNSKFSTDDIGRRVIPGERNNQKSSTVFFGCSFTFGRGLNDDQTLPAYFAQLHPEQKIYNYAVPGSGPQQMLRWIDSGLLKQTAVIPPQTAIYVFIPLHYSRVAGGFYEGDRFPFYTKENGQLQYQGLFTEARPWRSALQEALEGTRLLSALIQVFPPRISRADEELLCAVVTRSRDLFMQQFPDSQFVVAHYSLAFPTPPMTEALRHCAKENNLKLIEYEDLLSPAEAVIDVKYDIHPSARSNQLFAEKISKELP